MKKLLATLLALLLMCGTLLATAESYTPGTYTAASTGNNVDVPVEVQATFDENGMTNIQVVSHAETPGLGDKAFETLIPAMLEKQTVEVDVYTGATNSSHALMDAVKDCMAQASGQIPQTQKAGRKFPFPVNRKPWGMTLIKTGIMPIEHTSLSRKPGKGVSCCCVLA